jgi:hypothetical protein
VFEHVLTIVGGEEGLDVVFEIGQEFAEVTKVFGGREDVADDGRDKVRVEGSMACSASLEEATCRMDWSPVLTSLVRRPPRFLSSPSLPQ